MSDDEKHRAPHVSQVTRVDDEGNGPSEFLCHMLMRERPPLRILPNQSDTGGTRYSVMPTKNGSDTGGTRYSVMPTKNGVIQVTL